MILAYFLFRLFAVASGADALIRFAFLAFVVLNLCLHVACWEFSQVVRKGKRDIPI